MGNLVLLVVDQAADALARSCAVGAVPDREQLCDLVTGQTEVAGPRHEQQAGGRLVVVRPVARAGARRRSHQPDALVVAHGRGGHADLFGKLGDAHVTTINLERGFKVKT